MSITYETFRLICVHQHMLNSNENCVPNALSIKRAKHEPSKNANGSLGKEKIAIKLEEAAVNKKQQALEG